MTAPMTEEAIARVEALIANPDAHWNLVGPPEHDCVDVPVSDLRALLSLARQAGEMREALQKLSYQMNFLSRMADGQRRCERGKGRATWKTTTDAIRSEALVGEALARAALQSRSR